MRTTKYNKRITAQTATKAPNDIGGWKNTWADSFSCWASVTAMSRSKRFLYAELKYDEFYEVEMRKRNTNINGSNQIIYDGNAYQIISFTVTDNVVKLDIAR